MTFLRASSRDWPGGKKGIMSFVPMEQKGVHFIIPDEEVYSLKEKGPVDVEGGVYPPS